MDLEHFNSTPADQLRPRLLTCCDVPTWADSVIAARPYATPEDAVAAAWTAATELGPAEVDRALAAIPRIGEPAAGSSTEAAWAHQEQSGVGTDADTRAALAAGNRAYEERFNRAFLINSAGLDATAILAALNRRLANDPATEAAQVAREVRGIAIRRLARLLDAEDHGADDQQADDRGADDVPTHSAGSNNRAAPNSTVGAAVSTVSTHVLDTTLGRPASGVHVRFERLEPGTTELVATGVTDADGRVGDLGPNNLGPGTYRLTFEVAAYSASTGQDCFFPEVAITFALAATGGTVPHHHVPLLLSPFAYSTYKGS
jgi:2-oxo-4-hydroxy-4-carboxy-5-ureidoimidazoline decarboxylase